MSLSPSERARYARHILLPEVGAAGQERLKAAKVLLVGAGGLGSPAALYLAAAGVGTLGVAEFDAVDPSNLQRQVLYGTGDAGRPKLEAAARRLADLNPSVTVVPHPGRLTAEHALETVRRYDLVVDGSDDFATRYLVNDACALAGVPDVYGAVYRFEGQASVFWAAKGPCYRCLHPEPPPPGLVPNCAEAGVLGVLPGVVGTLQAAEALKLLLGLGEPLVGTLLVYDALAADFARLALKKDPACVLCGPRATLKSLVDYDRLCGAEGPVPTVSPEAFKAALAGGAGVLDVREDAEVAERPVPGARHIPLGQLESRLGELDPAARLVVVCRSGARSAKAVRLLAAKGFAGASSLAGGLAAFDLLDSAP